MQKFHWHRHINFGDALNPVMIQYLTGQLPVYSQQDAYEERIMMIGSILNAAHDKTIVWGTGIVSPMKIAKGIDIRSVRGPLTRQIAIDNGNHCPEIYGDPALLMPLLYNPIIDKTHKVGFIPHYAERSLNISLPSGMKFIDPAQSHQKFINDILSCQKIISSSLHGLIIADAYHIPSQWIKLSDSIIGDDTKYYDHMLSINMDTYKYWDFRGTIQIPTLYHIFENIPNRKKNINLKAIWDACPFQDFCTKKLF